jgi:hypothetical protein
MEGESKERVRLQGVDEEAPLGAIYLKFRSSPRPVSVDSELCGEIVCASQSLTLQTV